MINHKDYRRQNAGRTLDLYAPGYAAAIFSPKILRSFWGGLRGVRFVETFNEDEDFALESLVNGILASGEPTHLPGIRHDSVWSVGVHQRCNGSELVRCWTNQNLELRHVCEGRGETRRKDDVGAW